MNKKSIPEIINRIDQYALWPIGIIAIVIAVLPIILLKDSYVFPMHDQLDETFLAYVLSARHIFSKSNFFPEMLSGISKDSLQPSAPLFILLYCCFSPIQAFKIQYIILFFVAFLGMYFCIKELTNRSIIALFLGLCFAFLPFMPIYGTSTIGVPLIIYAIICLGEKKHLLCAYSIVIFFALTAHLVLLGFVVLGFWSLYLIYLFVKKDRKVHVFIAYVLLILNYLLINKTLVTGFFNSENSFISHREEFVQFSSPFFSTAKNLFLYGDSLHFISFHNKLIIPCMVGLCFFSLIIKKLSPYSRRCITLSWIILFCVIGVTIAYAFFASEPFVNWVNGQNGMLKSFSFSRVAWIYPSAWILLAATILATLWDYLHNLYLVKSFLILLFLYPFGINILYNSIPYMNYSEYNNGSYITGFIPLDSYFSEELFKQIEEDIGLEKSEYKIAHLGITPAVTIAHGFYTIDGYSNNYPLEYKHEYRKIIEKELEKSNYCKEYFDTWGSRCYLFNSQSGSYMMVSKDENITYENLDINTDYMKLLGCKYIFSAGEIANNNTLGLAFVGKYENASSIWRIWVYKIV